MHEEAGKRRTMMVRVRKWKLVSKHLVFIMFISEEQMKLSVHGFWLTTSGEEEINRYIDR